jgi:signal transduction histidine kinase
MKLVDQFLSFERAWSEDKIRKSYLLNFINLSLLIFLLFIISIRLFGNFFIDAGSNQESLWLLATIAGILLFLILLVKKGMVRLVAILLIALLLLSSLKGTWTWGIDLYTVDIMYPFIILLSAVLIGSRFSFVVLFVICAALATTFVLQDCGAISRDSLWRSSLPSYPNLLTIIVIYTLMTVLAWLSSREIEKSLQKSKKLAEKLRIQNENLELTVEQRTKELKTLQLNALTRIAPLLDLGKLSAGLVHDIRQPLSVLSIILDEARAKRGKLDNLDLAFGALKQIEDLSSISATKFFCKSELEIFNLNQEISKLLSLFEYKASKKKVNLVFKVNQAFDLQADRKKLMQVLANLILNAIESYDELGKKDKTVFIKLLRNSRHLIITVKDYGVGINQANIAKLFAPNFSLKNPDNSLGLGLYVGQEIMKKYFLTSIKVESSHRYGTSFSLIIKNKFILDAKT